MIIQIPTNLNSLHLSNVAHKAGYDFKHGHITEEEALSLIDPYSEVLDRMEQQHKGVQ